MGKGAQAVEWARKVMDYVNRAHLDTEGEVLTNIGDRLDLVHWVVRYDSLAEMEKTMEAVEQDEQYQALLQEQAQAGLLLNARDHLYRVRS